MTSRQRATLAELWPAPPTAVRPFQPDALTTLPPLAQHYLGRAIASGTPLATAVHLNMHGTIKLGPNWCPFKAEEVIHWQRGMIWKATTWVKGLPIMGADRIVDGVGAMQWKMLGLFTVIQAAGPDTSRSAVGRAQGELVWLPSVLYDPAVTWQPLGPTTLQATFTAFGEAAQLTLTVNDQGTLDQVQFERWGNPDGGDYRFESFGVKVQNSGTFGGYTIPTQLSAGWYLGSDRYESEGEFFRCTIDRAVYR